MVSMISRREKSLGLLEGRLRGLGPEERSAALGLLRQYRTRGWLTAPQWGLVGMLYAQVGTAAELVPATRPQSYLYALRAGSAVKLGHSCDIARRIRELQIGNPNKVTLVWSMPVARPLVMERKLHRFCRKYHRRGEWYDAACLPSLATFAERRP